VVADVDSSNENASLIADFNERGSLPADSFDCIILTQVLQYTNPWDALMNLWQSLKPGGVLLLTVPSLSRLDPVDAEIDSWRWTPAGMKRLLDPLPTDSISVVGFGNLLTCQGFMLGLAQEELDKPELDHVDERFPLLVCAKATKGEAS
jgi:SAM-dependent methyltransferase